MVSKRANMDKETFFQGYLEWAREEERKAESKLLFHGIWEIHEHTEEIKSSLLAGIS